MAQSEKNRLTGPLDATCPGIVIQGIPLAVIGDFPEGAFIQVIHGENPLGQPVPGPQLAKGCMLVVIPADVANNIRPALKQAEAQAYKALGQPYVQDGNVVPASAFPDRSKDARR